MGKAGPSISMRGSERWQPDEVERTKITGARPLTVRKQVQLKTGQLH